MTGPILRELVKPEPSSAMTNYGKHFKYTTSTNSVGKVARTKQCMLGFETALDARVHGDMTLKTTQTKKSLKYSYLLTQEHET